MTRMKKNKGMVIVFSAILVLILGIIVSGNVFRYYHPTHYKFNDKFVIDNTLENIEERYGPLEFQGYTTDGLKVGRYLAEESSPKTDLFGHPSYDVWYCIYFNEDDIAQKVSLQSYP